MINETIKHQLNHRTIRAFKPTNLSAEQLNTLYSVASHTPTSMFMQQMSIMHITDPDKRAAIRKCLKMNENSKAKYQNLRNTVKVYKVRNV